MARFSNDSCPTGRRASTDSLGLSKLGVRVDPHSRKVLTSREDRTDCENIFAVGDVANVRNTDGKSALRAEF